MKKQTNTIEHNIRVHHWAYKSLVHIIIMSCECITISSINISFLII